MQKKLIIAAGVAIIAIAAIFLVLPKDNTSNTATTVPNASQGTSGEQAGLPTYSATDVAKHNSKSDCWTIISGSVYNLTSYIPHHDGGDEILRACGIDGTTLFTQRHTASGQAVGSGTPHSSQAERDLARLKIGTLAN